MNIASFCRACSDVGALLYWFTVVLFRDLRGFFSVRFLLVTVHLVARCCMFVPFVCLNSVDICCY